MKTENSKSDENKWNDDPDRREWEMPVCDYAPEWSEHARFDRLDEPCDDGRMGSRPCAEGKGGDACPVTQSPGLVAMP